MDADGYLACAAPPAASLHNASASLRGPAGIPDDGQFHRFLTVNAPAGTYLLVAKGAIGSNLNVDDFRDTSCRLNVGGTIVDDISLNSQVTNEVTRVPFALTEIAVSPGADITLACRADPGADGMTLAEAKLVAVRVG